MIYRHNNIFLNNEAWNMDLTKVCLQTILFIPRMSIYYQKKIYIMLFIDISL